MSHAETIMGIFTALASFEEPDTQELNDAAHLLDDLRDGRAELVYQLGATPVNQERLLELLDALLSFEEPDPEEVEIVFRLDKDIRDGFTEIVYQMGT